MPRMQPFLRDLCNSKFPSPTLKLKRWAIIGHPSGMMSCKSSGIGILVRFSVDGTGEADKNVRSPIAVGPPSQCKLPRNWLQAAAFGRKLATVYAQSTAKFEHSGQPLLWLHVAFRSQQTASKCL